MASWAGFSDAELLRLQQKEQPTPIALGRGRKPTQANRSRQQLQRERALQIASQQHADTSPPALPAEQKLTKPPPKVAPPTKATAACQDDKLITEQLKDGEPSTSMPVKADEHNLKELEKQEVELREKTRIEQLQDEQKTMEERNKCKKALLAKTIAEKSKQTQQEALKLKRIQKELQTLDDMVSNDIGILRGRIEQASWDYNTARKRYEKAEAEYVTSKLDLHKKTEVKEQLTEHLCAIIQQNEMRKAHKLEELMKQLQLQATEEELNQVRKMVEEEEEEEKRKRKAATLKSKEVELGAKQNGEKVEQNGEKVEQNAEQAEQSGEKVEQNAEQAEQSGEKVEQNAEQAEQSVEKAELCSDPDRGSAALETGVPGSACTLSVDPPPATSDLTGPGLHSVAVENHLPEDAASAGPS